MTSRFRLNAIGLAFAAACGGRSALDVGAAATSTSSSASGSSSASSGSSSGVASSSSSSSSSSGACAFPALPPPTPAPPLGAACAFSSANPSSAPVFAAMAGTDLVAVSPQGTITKLFSFPSSFAPDGMASVTSRGNYLAALMTVGGGATVSVELVLLRLDGTVVVHHTDTFAIGSEFGGGQAVAGNRAGTFAFGAWLGNGGRVWVASADGQLRGPFDGLQPGFAGMETDERGRVLVLPVDTNSTANVSWLDPCSGSMTAPTLDVGSGNTASWGAALFGVTTAGQPSRETADGLAPLAVAPFPMSSLWDFHPPGVAMLAVPPFPTMPESTTGNLAILDAVNLTAHAVSLSYPPALTAPLGSYLGSVDASSSPAGFGVDSSSNVTMFLQAADGSLRFHVTADGSVWQPVGPSYATPTFLGELAAAEAGGTYVLHGGGPNATNDGYTLVRPASGVQVKLTGDAAHIARDGGCVASVTRSGLEIVSAVTGARSQLPLSAVPTFDQLPYWAATWIPGDDAVLWSP